MEKRSALEDWTAEQIAQGRQWVETWRRAGKELERIRRKELRSLDAYQAIAVLTGPVSDILKSVRRTTTGLQEQQKWFKKVAQASV